MNDWLKQRALQNENKSSRTFVVTLHGSEEVIGYYTLAFGAIYHDEAVGKVRRNMPDPVPAMLLGRLAVASGWQGKGIGSGMLKDAILKSVAAAEYAGLRAIFVHAIDEAARNFYSAWGFAPSPLNPMTLMITLDEAYLSISAKPPKARS